MAFIALQPFYRVLILPKKKFFKRAVFPTQPVIQCRRNQCLTTTQFLMSYTSKFKKKENKT